jgi:ATP-dependent protease HslVU (ClpYQ) peptidase subunit
MSTVVAVQTPKFAVIGSDTQINWGDRRVRQPVPASKLQPVGEYLIGYAGDLRAGQILHYIFVPPKPVHVKQQYDLDQFVTASLVPKIKDVWEDNGYINSEDGTSLLVVVMGVVYEIGSDYSWSRDERNIYGIGSGGDYALGYLSSFEAPTTRNQTENLVVEAVGAASEYDINTSTTAVVYFQPIKRGWT